MHSPNPLLGTTELLAKLDALKAVAQDFAAREEKLSSAHRAGTAKANESFAAADHQANSASALRQGAEVDGFAAAKVELQAQFARRSARINRVHNRVREQMSSRITTQDEDCKTRAQQGLITAERIREENLVQANVTAQNFQQRYADAAAEFQQVEKSVRRAFGGVGSFGRLVNAPTAALETNPADDGNGMLDEASRVSEKIKADLIQFKKFPVPQLFRFLPVWFFGLLLLGVAVAVPLLKHFGSQPVDPQNQILFGALGTLFLILVIYFLGTRSAAPLAKKIAADFLHAKQLVDSAPEQSAIWLQSEQARIENEFVETKNSVNAEWKRGTKEIAAARNRRPVEVETRVAQLEKRNGNFLQSALAHAQSAHEEKLARLRAAAAQQLQTIASAHQEKLAKLEAEFQNGWRELETGWKQEALPLAEAIHTAGDAAEKTFPDWPSLNPRDWQAPQKFLNAAKFARLEIETQKFFTALPKDKRLALPCPAVMSLPLLLTQPQHGSLLIETNKLGDGEALAAMNNLILRLLATTPPGRVEFTIFDPVGLGQNFATLMHLADYEAGAINSRIWTQSAQFEEKLADLSEHMEKIIQMYLRNEYATIAEYNASAGSTAEKYHVLVIASFPVNFTDTAAKRLRNIAASGARCGVFTLIHWDQRNAAPSDFVPDELRKNSVCLVRGESGFEFSNWHAPGAKLIFDEAPSAEFATEFLHRVGELGRNSNRVEVPFESVAPAEMWLEETSEILRVPIGRSGATKFQNLEIGSGTRQHALIAGKTGSGKSTLFHVIITNLALRCSPEQVEFYLVDFKKGVEFKCYGTRRLPHARVVAIESDREFGLSVLQRVDDELRRRGDLFRKVGAQDLVGYKRSGATEPIPRTLLMIDEFQEFFTEEDRISQGAAVLLDRIVRQGRAFGIHVLLGSQTLGGAYTLARATIGQMVIRIALQCNEADAYLIMDQDNPAPRLLDRKSVV